MPLIVTLRGGRGKEVWFTREARLGRRNDDPLYTLRAWLKEGEGAEAEEELGIYDYSISRSHARLYPQGGSLFLHDLGSRHGTYLNEQQIPWAGRGSPAEPVPVPLGKSQLRLGPRSALEVGAFTSPAGLWVPGAQGQPLEELRHRLEMEQDLQIRWKRLEQELEKERLEFLSQHTEKVLIMAARSPYQAELITRLRRLEIERELPQQSGPELKAMVREVLVKLSELGQLKPFFEEMVQMLKGQMDMTKEDSLLALDKFVRFIEISADSNVKRVKEMQRKANSQ